jgi:gas vesicle protein
MNKILTIVGAIALSLLIFSSASSANAAFFSGKDLITPDSSFSFLQTWKESIQTFFTFGLENKAKQYLHLADVRLNEYKNLLEQGKTDIAQKTLDKYKKQLNQALGKAEELKGKGMDVKDLSQKIEETVSRHLEVLQENLQKVPEQAKKGLENAIENSQKQVEKILEKKIEKQNETAKPVPSEVEGLSPELVEGRKTYRNEEYGFEVRYPNEWKFEGKIGTPPSPTFIYRYGEKSYCRFNVVVTNIDDDGAISAFRNEGYSEAKITIGGISAIRLSKSPVGMNLESRDYVYFNKGLNYYRITRMSFQDANEEKCLKTFNQILSTFKFIK